jgi:hypothetical protein
MLYYTHSLNSLCEKLSITTTPAKVLAAADADRVRRHSRLDWKKNRAAVMELSACRL